MKLRYWISPLAVAAAMSFSGAAFAQDAMSADNDAVKARCAELGTAATTAGDTAGTTASAEGGAASLSDTNENSNDNADSGGVTSGSDNASGGGDDNSPDGMTAGDSGEQNHNNTEPKDEDLAALTAEDCAKLGL